MSTVTAVASAARGGRDRPRSPGLLTDALLDMVNRPEQLDEPRLERTLGRFLARYFAAGVTPDARMFTHLFRIVADYRLAVPPEIATAFRALATMEGTLTQLAVLMIGIHGGPALSKTVSLYSFFGYCLLVIAAILAVRVLVQVFSPDPE